MLASKADQSTNLTKYSEHWGGAIRFPNTNSINIYSETHQIKQQSMLTNMLLSFMQGSS